MWLHQGANHRWDVSFIGYGVAALGLGLLGQSVITSRSTAAVATFAGHAVLWILVGGAVLFAYRKSVPRGLFTFRRADIILGIGCGLVVRFVVDALRWRSEGYLAWPTLNSVDGHLAPLWWLDAVVAALVISPVVESLFFQGFLLVAMYTVMRRAIDSSKVAGVSAALVVAAILVGVNILVVGSSLSGLTLVSLALTSLVASALVLLTGRYWSALVLHVTLNALGLVVALVGTLASSTIQM
jgi:membrane protease YdiL (CAAX protease family)